MAPHLIQALFSQQQLCNALKVAMPNCMSQLALLYAAGDIDIHGGCEGRHQRLGLKAEALHPSGLLLKVELLIPARLAVRIFKSGKDLFL